MVTTWLPLGYHMVTTWLPWLPHGYHGYHMVTTWLPHGNHYYHIPHGYHDYTSGIMTLLPPAVKKYMGNTDIGLKYGLILTGEVLGCVYYIAMAAIFRKYISE